MEINKKPTVDNVQRVSNLETLIPKWSVFLKPFPEGSGAWQEDFKNQVGECPQTKQGWYTYEFRETVTAITKSVQIQPDTIKHWEGEVNTKSYP